MTPANPNTAAPLGGDSGNGAAAVSDDAAWTASLSSLTFNWRDVDAVRNNCIGLDNPLNELQGKGVFSSAYPQEKAQTDAAQALAQWSAFKVALGALPSDCLVPHLGGTPTYNGSESCTKLAQATSSALTALQQQAAFQTVQNNHAGSYLESSMAAWDGPEPDCQVPSNPTENPNKSE